MKRNTKGFTLIELLAVIVILAIIALIATPIVLNLINKAREGAAKDSAFGVRKATQLYYQTKLIDSPETGFTDTVIQFGSTSVTQPTGWNANTVKNATTIATDGFQLDGTNPSSGWVVINSAGKIKGCVKINNYYCGIGNSGSINCSTTSVAEVAANGAPACSSTTITTASAPA